MPVADGLGDRCSRCAAEDFGVGEGFADGASAVWDSGVMQSAGEGIADDSAEFSWGEKNLNGESMKFQK